MPELPEVETTRRGIEPHLQGRTIVRTLVRQPRLRWPVPADLAQRLTGHQVASVGRRAKYLQIRLADHDGCLLVHLGMSGSLRLVEADQPAGRHDHVELWLDSGQILRYTDPRRFGAWLWSNGLRTHPLLARLGPEPLEADFHGEHLYQRSRGRSLAVKPFIMDNQVVVGVGNIYASEALFAAGIDPRRPAGRLTLDECQRLATEIRVVLDRAILQGGTTLRDFVGGDGQPGYFSQQLLVYGRAGEACSRCGQPLQDVRLGQRASVFCGHCQH